jgi:hypothetical protein
VFAGRLVLVSVPKLPLTLPAVRMVYRLEI